MPAWIALEPCTEMGYVAFLQILTKFYSKPLGFADVRDNSKKTRIVQYQLCLLNYLCFMLFGFVNVTLLCYLYLMSYLLHG